MSYHLIYNIWENSIQTIRQNNYWHIAKGTFFYNETMLTALLCVVCPWGENGNTVIRDCYSYGRNTAWWIELLESSLITRHADYVAFPTWALDCGCYGTHAWGWDLSVWYVHTHDEICLILNLFNFFCAVNAFYFCAIIRGKISDINTTIVQHRLIMNSAL